jgi:pectinesterase
MLHKKLNFLLILILSTVLLLRITAEEADTIIVSKNKNCRFASIQDALNSIDCHAKKKIVIVLKKGNYFEKITLFPIRAKVILIGEERDSTIISYNDYSGKIITGDTLTTHNSYTFRIGSDYFEARNITFENTAGQVGQAVAVEVKGDCVTFKNCRFLGNQDTFYANSDGRIYIKNCYIEGTTDFIFGKSIVLFDSCKIYCKKNSYITAASTPENTKFGFVFRNCSVQADSFVKEVFLGRPWRSFARTVFINCYLGSFIIPSGWNNWSNPDKEKTVFYAEYGTYGPGAVSISLRVGWSHQLDKNEALAYTIENIFSKRASNINFPNDWKPQ